MLTPSKNRNWLGALLMFSPVLVCMLIMLPRLGSPQFGLLDDGTTIATSQQMAAGKWNIANEVGSGRFRPAYWLYYGAIYLAAGPDARAFFTGNLLLFVFITAGLVTLVRINGGTRLAAGLAGLFFALAGAAIENFYTLSKPEAPQLLGFTLLLIAVSAYARVRHKAVKALLVVLALLAMAWSMSVKETGVAMVPISLAWLGIAWLVERRQAVRLETASRLVLVGSALVISAGFILLRTSLVTLGLPGGGYSSNYAFTLQRFLSSGLRWAGWLVRDYLYILPLALFLLALWIKQRSVPSGRRYLEWFVWMGVWIAIYLPWVYSLEYYLLPFALGCAAFCGLAVDQAVRYISQSGRIERFFLAACLASSFLLLLITLPNNVTNGRLQLVVDAANAEMLNYVADKLPQNGTLLVNLPQGYEYYHEIELHLDKLYHRSDILVQRFPFISDEAEQKTPVPFTIISPQIKNPPSLSVRLGVNEGITAQGSKAVRQLLGPDASPGYIVGRRYQLFTIDFLRIVCPLFRNRGYCAASNAVIDRTWLSYGWDIYTVTSHPQRSGAQ
jgi:hypothetical protein